LVSSVEPDPSPAQRIQGSLPRQLRQPSRLVEPVEPPATPPAAPRASAGGWDAGVRRLRGWPGVRAAFAGHAPPVLAAILAALSVVAAVWFVDQGEQDRARRQVRTEVQHRVGEARAKLEQALSARLHLAQGLAAYVAANPGLERPSLDAYARSLLAVQPGIRHVALTEGSTIIYAYPEVGNEGAIGVDLLTIPDQRDAVRRALLNRQFVLAGPVELLQGGVALVARQPVILPPDGTEEDDQLPPGVGPSGFIAPASYGGPRGRVWGLALVVFHLGPLMGDAGLLDTTSSLEWALRGTDGWGAAGDMIFGRPGIFDERPETQDVTLPTGSWQLAAAPLAGWAYSTPTLGWVRISGGILALLLAMVVYSLVRDPVRLREAVERATAAAVENARLYESERNRAERAAIDERQRLARELHDSVTQTLFSASLIAEVLPRLWARNPAVAQPRLEELRQLTRGALAEMRTLLLELRPAVLLQMPLADLLRQLTEAVTGRARLPVTLEVEGGGDTPPTPLPAEVQMAFYRTAQEALNNIVKHAGATSATVSLRWLPGGLQLGVHDDGRGFDPAAVPAGHLGLGGMHERAAAIGATLFVRAAPGEGTHLTLDWQPKPAEAGPPAAPSNGASRASGSSPKAPTADGHTPALVDSASGASAPSSPPTA
jgi:signal transduction histidine kinase